MPVVRNGWPGQSSRLDRRRARDSIVLEDVGITETTLERYYYAVSRMLPVLEDVSTEAAMDDAISEWIQEEFSDGSQSTLLEMRYLEFTTLNQERDANCLRHGDCTVSGGDMKFLVELLH